MADEGEYPKIDGDIYYGDDANMSYYQATLNTTANYGAVSVTSSGTTILAANSARKALLIFNNGNETIYVGTTGVTIADGIPLEPFSSMFFYDTELVAGDVTTGPVDIRYWEVE